MSYFQVITRAPLAASIKSIILVTVFGIMSLIELDQEKKVNGPVIKEIWIEKDKLELNRLEGRWYFNQTVFNGYAITRFENGRLKEKIGFSNGKKQGPAYSWHNDGVLASEKKYVANRQEGISKTWWPNGQLSSESNYKNRIRHGEQKRWYPNGLLARVMHFNEGKEEGLQQAWLPSGKHYVNYEAKHGRFFGLRRSNLCYELKDEVVQK